MHNLFWSGLPPPPGLGVSNGNAVASHGMPGVIVSRNQTFFFKLQEMRKLISLGGGLQSDVAFIGRVSQQLKFAHTA